MTTCRTCGGNEANHCLTVFARNRDLRAAWVERDRLVDAARLVISLRPYKDAAFWHALDALERALEQASEEPEKKP